MDALTQGAVDTGADVTQIGLISTDCIDFAVGHYGFDGGIMITASHNPAESNGLKSCREEGTAIALETGLADVRDAFAQHCWTFIDDVAAIKPFTISIDAGNGMAGETVPRMFKHLPQVTVVPMYFELDGTFPNHPASPIEPENMAELRRAVIANGCDLGVAFDGDADRMFIVDENAALVGGDIVTALVGSDTLRHRPGAKILFHLISSRSVPEAIRAHGGIPVRSKVGHSIIEKVMRDENVPFGGEHSGHFYFKRNWFADSGTIALMQCLNVFSTADGTPSSVIAPIDRRVRSGETNSTVADIPAKLVALERHYADAAIDRLDGLTFEYADWWMNVRASNTEPLLRLNVEGDTRALMEQHRDEALALIRD